MFALNHMLYRHFTSSDIHPNNVPSHQEFAISPTPSQVRNFVLANTLYRAVMFTDTLSDVIARTQQVAMALGSADNPQKNIGWEQHTSTTQTFIVMRGKGRAILSQTNDYSSATSIPVGPGDTWTVTPGTYHDVIADTSMKLCTMYTPPHHPLGTIQQRAI